MLVVPLAAGCSAEQAPSGEEQTAPSTYASALVRATEEARTAEGLPELERDRCADRVARERAAALVGEDLEHRPLNAFVEQCAPGHRAAENLVETDRAAAEVVDAWMESPGHRNNIVDPALTRTGVGCAESGSGLVCSQLFLGTPP
jgi:uncharacterized protein YkwD